MTQFKFAPYQQGAALIVCLMMLVVMTILGVSAVTTTTMEEKMVGNIRNKHVSFQAAEAALRAAETVADGMSQGTVYDGTNGLYARSTPGDANYPIWEWSGSPATNWQTIATATGAVQSPEYIIEDFGLIARDNSCELDVANLASCYLSVYRVTSRGWGLNTNALSVLQSTYKQP